jgi:photosystem II stability/assembly factor-like uncharacterized protein
MSRILTSGSAMLRQLIVPMLGITLLSACGDGGGGGGGSATPASPTWERVDLPINLIESMAVSPLDRRIVYAGQTSAVNAEHAVWRSDDGGESFHVVAKGVSFPVPSPTDPDRVFGTVTEPDSWAGWESQALYLSRDRGENWEPAFKDGKGVLLRDDNPGRGIGQHPQQRDTIYAFGRRRDTLDGAVFKSSDGGTSWVDVTPQGIALSPGDEGYFVFDPLDVDTVFLSCHFTLGGGALLRTVDGGKSWQVADAGLTANEHYHYLHELVATTLPGVLVGVSDLGQLWINSDGGAGAWRPLPFPPTVGQFLWSSQLPNTLVVLTWDGAMQRSDDLGNTWQPVVTPGSITAWTLDDSEPLGILITTAEDEALYRTVDAGQTWTLLPKPPFSVSYFPGGYGSNRVAVSVAAQDHLIAFRAPRLEVLAGGTWQIPGGLESFHSTFAVSSLASFGNRLAAAAAGWGGALFQEDLLFQQDLQGNWTRVSLPDGDWAGARLSSDGDRRGIYGGVSYYWLGSGTRFQGTIDGGEHWAGTADDRFGDYTGEAVFDTPNGRFWYLATGLLNRTTGDMWWEVHLVGSDGSIKSASAGLPGSPTEPLNALANSPQAPSRLYVGTSQGIYRSLDGGASWNPAFPAGSGSPVSAIAVDPNDSMIVWALGTTGLTRSNDGGDHWTAVAPEHFTSGKRALAVHPSRSGVVVVSDASGIWLSVDAGVNWQNVGGPREGVNQVLIVDEAINVATDSGLFRCASLCQPP